jgi:Fe2+ transport system protein FeoA
VVEVSRKLVNVEPGETVRIAEVGGDSRAASRLLDLGLIRGTTVKVIRVAPLGDPIEIALRGFMLTLRRAEAEQVLVD